MVLPLLLGLAGIGGGEYLKRREQQQADEARKQQAADVSRFMDYASNPNMARSNGIDLDTSGLQNITGRRLLGQGRTPNGLLAGAWQPGKQDISEAYGAPQQMQTRATTENLSQPQRQAGAMGILAKYNPTGAMEMATKALFEERKPGLSESLYGRPEVSRNPITGRVETNYHSPGPATPRSNAEANVMAPRIAAAEPFLTDSDRSNLTMRAMGLSQPDAPPGTKQAFDTLTQRPVFVTDEQIAKSPDRYQPIQSGMEIESDGQGGFRLRTNVSGNNSGGQGGPTPTTKTRLQESLIDTTDNISRLNDIEAQFKPEYQQISGRWNALRTAGLEKLGRESSPEERQYLEDFSAYRADSIDFLNNYISTISGAQVSAEEASRLTAGFPNPGQGLIDGDSPTQFLSKLNATKKRLMAARARSHYALNQGLTQSQMFAIPLGSMNEIVDERGAEIEQQVRKENPDLDATTIQNIVDQRLKQEFGI